MTTRNTRSKSKAASLNIDETANQPDGVTFVQDEVAKMTWWDSGKASDTFGLYKPTVAEENEDVEPVVSERLKRCRLAYQSAGGWRQLIDDLDCKSLYTEHDQFQLRWRCRYLAKALDIAQKKIKHPYSWEDCCKEAIDNISSEEGESFLSSAFELQYSTVHFVPRESLHFSLSAFSYCTVLARLACHLGDPRLGIDPIKKPKFVFSQQTSVIVS
jgi:hypothetical protein